MEFEPDMLQNLETAHKNFLKTAVYFLYSYNRLAFANQWFQYMVKKYPGAVPDGQTLDEFALAKVTEDVGGKQSRPGQGGARGVAHERIHEPGHW